MRLTFKLAVSVKIVLVMCFSLFIVSCGKKEQDVSGKQAATDEAVIQAQQAAGVNGFSWDMAKGAKIKVLLNQHMYAEAIIKKIADFTQKTGIEVDYAITPEENYFDKVTTSLNSRSGDPDIFMTGAYQIWEYGAANFIQDLTPFIEDSNLTGPDYDIADFYEGVLGACRWDLIPGHKTGAGPYWGLPLGFEIYSLAYNKKVFADRGLAVPKTMEELIEICEKLKEFDGRGTYPIAFRGSRNWATIHPGYMSTFANYGAQDFVIENCKLVSKVNSPESVKMTEDWVKLIKVGGSPSWSSYTWYQAGADLGAGKAAMLFDADINGIHQNWKGASKETGNIAWAVMPLPAGQQTLNSNLWTWALAMNKSSKNKLAAWLFMQYFTGKEYALWASLEMKSVDPARASVWENSEFKKMMSQQSGYLETFKATINGTRILFTPQPHFFETTTEWAATLQKIVAGQYDSVQQGMDELKEKMDEAVEYLKTE
ncbi:MAG: sugar ABC transporter substrate-binding protein [Sedimentisphaerales bacterium]|nr:sugar ABC transporter substrate-binding protein [Sedimentisphaerales bacterium]